MIKNWSGFCRGFWQGALDAIKIAFAIGPVFFLLACILPIFWGMFKKWDLLIQIRSIDAYVNFLNTMLIETTFMNVIGMFLVFFISLFLPLVLVLGGLVIFGSLWASAWHEMWRRYFG